MTRAEFDTAYGIRTDGQAHLGPVNLDGADLEDLNVAAEHPALHADVRDYARCKAAESRCRTAGVISMAAAWERQADNAYHNMPARCRW